MFGEFDNIRQTVRETGYIGTYGGTNVAPYMYTFPKAGKHLVKLYDTKCNIYNIVFNNPRLVGVYVDWTEIPTRDEFLNSLAIYFRGGSSGMDSIYWGVPNGQTGLSFPEHSSWNDYKTLDKLVLLNNDSYVNITESALRDYTNMVFDAVFPNVTNLSKNAFRMCGEIHYASFPKIVSIGEASFWMGSFQSSEVNRGVYTLRIGDTLQSLGIHAFYGCEKLTTIEFVTDQEDFVAAWNNHAIFPNWLGTASKQEGDGEDEATITPIPGSVAKNGPYYTNTRNPKPTRLVRIRRGN